MKLSSLTDIGIKRKDNQDNYWSARLSVNEKEVGVVCLCDGMGGLDNGGLASRVVVEAVKEFFTRSVDLDELVKVVKNANSLLYNKSVMERISLGTTCTILYCCDGAYHILHIGDSRCYKKSTEDDKVHILTSDHTVLAKYSKAGKTLPPHLVKKYKNTLTRCIGVASSIDLDYYTGTYSEGDLFLVCSDGFWHFLDYGSFYNSDFSDLQELINSFIVKGETDNITVGILEC
ncbi:PP2C family protein-serine/threonine phosphatase [Clostridium baratii]